MYKLIIVDDEKNAREGIGQLLKWGNFDVEVVDIVGNPGCLKLEKGLVDVVFDVSLGVAEEDHAERIGIVEMLLISAVLRRSAEAYACRHGG